jgi:predicted PurR-regulated permease PerM
MARGLDSGVFVGQAHPMQSSRRTEAADLLIRERRERVRRQRGAPGQFLRLLVTALCLFTLVVMSPLWAPLLLAGWTAILVRSPQERLGHKLGGSRRAAAALTVAFVMVLIVPAVLITISLVGGAVDMVKNAIAAGGGIDSVRALFSGGSGAKIEAQTFDRVFELAQQHGAGAWRALTVIAGATANVVIGAFVFVLGLYVFLVDGKRLDRWLELNMPLPRGAYRRFAAAFVETGRGLFIGVGLTAAAQAIVLTIGYFAIGLPQAAMFGAVTLVAALIPAGGAGIIWAPLSVGLAVTGRISAAVVVLVLGLIASTGDNFLRPWLSRYAKLRLPTFALLVAMLGGVGLLGAWGLLLGPLLMRWAVEGLALIREARMPATAR